ncbi:hypothetical protein F5Y15DRAFT_260989 [Xylariaceae sp. FL0016]|nr:hypothetical protein F5Y15DRAFT_260989 [Xylariaceae sp. FL0016]
MAPSDQSSMPFIRNLASSDRKIRTTALDTLRTFLTASTTSRQLTTLDAQKIWKGLFYSLWMCDRAIPQQKLCAELADLITTLPDDAVAPWLEAFWMTMSREWTSIDVLRMEKFLLLVRRVFGASLSWAKAAATRPGRKTSGKKRKWDAGKADGVVELLAAWPLEPTGDLSKVPVGLRFHVLDIWVDELEKLDLLAGDGMEYNEILENVGEMVGAQSKSTCKPVRIRAKESLTDERLPWNGSDEPNQHTGKSKHNGVSSDNESWDGVDS